MNSLFRSRIRLWLSVVLTLAFGAAQAQEAVVETAPETDPPGRVARLSLIDGEVSFAPAGTDEWAEAVLNRPITSDDRLWVGGDARAELQIGSATVHVDRSTGFGFIELDDDVMQMSLTEGAATLRVRRLGEGERILLETPNATVRVLHPGEYHFQVDPQTDRTIVKVRSGEAEVTGAGPLHRVQAGRQGVFTGLQTLHAQIERIDPRTPFENWANDRERTYAQAESSRYVSRDVIGYEDLDDHGEWLHEPEYGHVWRPRYVAADWAPYRFGRWAWVSPWGWTWIDDARWGFAPFHYGRWVHVSHRWCWVPGPRHLRPVYAPALVGWVGGPSVSVSISFGPRIGWFPLGPREVYVPYYRHTPRYIRHVNVSNTIIVNNTYITNVYGRHARPHDYRYRRHAHAVTAVHRDHFVAGRSLGRERVHVSEGQLREWRDDLRGPAFVPRRESVLAAQRRDPRHVRIDAARVQRDPERRLSHRDRSRVDFDTERRAIEANGGRPVSRSDLRRAAAEPPKSRGDFIRRDQPDAIKRESHRALPLDARAAASRERPQQFESNSQPRAFVQDRERAQRLSAEREVRSERTRQANAGDRSREWRNSPPNERLQVTPERRSAPASRERQIQRAEPPRAAIRQAPPALESRTYSAPRPSAPAARAQPSRESSSSRASSRSSGERRGSWSSGDGRVRESRR